MDCEDSNWRREEKYILLYDDIRINVTIFLQTILFRCKNGMKLQGDFDSAGIPVKCQANNTYDMTPLDGKICVSSKLANS